MSSSCVHKLPLQKILPLFISSMPIMSQVIGLLTSFIISNVNPEDCSTAGYGRSLLCCATRICLKTWQHHSCPTRACNRFCACFLNHDVADIEQYDFLHQDRAGEGSEHYQCVGSKPWKVFFYQSTHWCWFCCSLCLLICCRLWPAVQGTTVKWLLFEWIRWDPLTAPYKRI